MRRTVSTPLGVSLLLLATAVHAQPSPSGDPPPTTQPPQQVFAEGMAAFEAGDFTTALDRFQRVYITTRNADVLFNVARSLEALGRRQDAATAYRRFLSLAPNSEQRAEATRRAEALERPATTTTTASTTNTTQTTRVEVAPPITQPPPPPPQRRRWALPVLIGGGALAVVGLLVGVTASDPGADPAITNEDDYLAERDARSSRQLLGGVLGGVGLAAAVVGAVGLALPVSSERATVRLNVRPVLGGATMGVTVHAF